MAINDEIAAGVKPIQIENPLNNMVKFANIQNDMANLQLHRQKAEADAAGMARKNELYSYLGSGGRDPNRIFQLGGHEELNQIRQGESARITGEKTAGETLDAGLARHRKMLGEWVNNPEEARQWLATGFGDPATKKHYESSGSYGDLAKRIPTDPAAFADWKEKAVIGMDKFLTNREAKHFSDTGGQIIATDSQNRPIGAPMDKTLTPEQGLTAFPGLAEAQAERKQLVEGIKQGATNMQNTANSPELAFVFKTQQAARYEELSKLDKDIIGMQGQAAQGKHASAEFLQVSARLEQLRAAGQENGPEGKALQARIAKETYIPPASMDLSPDQNAALYGPNGSVTQGRLDPYKVNGRTAKVYANAEITNPGTNFNQLGGAAALNRNAQFMGKQLTIEMLPKMLSNMSEAGKKLNFNDNKYFGAVQAWYKGASNDPEFISYMAQRNDVLLTLMGAMRSVGASDLAHRAEIDAAPQNMSPRAFDAYVAGQYKALEPRLAQAAKFTGSKPSAETPNAPAQTRTGATVSNWK